MNLEPAPHLDDLQLQAIVEGESSIGAYVGHLDRCEECRTLLGVAQAIAPERPTRSLRIGRYEIHGLLGEGGMGVVYRAWDPEIRRELALKVWASTSAHARALLLHEARALARLDHPGLARIHDAGHDEAAGTFIAVPLIEGETLRVWSRGPASVRERFRVLLAVAEAIVAAHDAGVTHGDLKPENVLVRSDGVPVLTDFGLAHLDGRGPSGGTRGYLAPEDRSSPLGDQFAFCVMAREVMGSGALSRRLSRVWDRGTRADPARRWRDMTAVASAMRSARHRWLILGLAAASVLGVVAGSAFASEQEPCPLEPERVGEDWEVQRSSWSTRLEPRELSAMDDYVSRWIDAAQRACVDPSGRACVLRAAAEVEALRQQVERSESPWSLGIVAWIAQLPDPAACFQPPAAFVPSPALAEARAKRRAGDIRGAAEDAGRIALSTNDPTVAAEGELLRGKALVAFDEQQARQSLWRATVAALSLERPDLEAEGLIALALLDAREPVRAEDAQRLLACAETLVRQHELALAPAVAFARGAVARALGDPTASLDAVALADRLAREQLSPTDPFRLQYALEHGNALAGVGRHEDAAKLLREVAARSAAALGERHPRTALVDAELAAQLANLGEWSEARELQVDAIERMIAAMGPDAVIVTDMRRDLGIVLVELDETEEAEQLLLDLHLRNDALGRTSKAIECLCLSGDAALARDDVGSARALYARAIAYAEAKRYAGPIVGGCLARLGVAMQGEPQAKATLERALVLLEQPGAAPLDLSLARFELARTIVEQDGVRAQALARDALDVLAEEGVVARRRRAEISAVIFEWENADAGEGTRPVREPG